MLRYLPLFSFLLTSLLGSAESSLWAVKTSEDMDTELTFSSLSEVYSNGSIEPESVSIPYYLNVYVGDSTTISPVLSPNNAQTTFNWYSKDPSIVEVRDGIVYGIEKGETDIYCVTANDKTSNNCHVTVFDPANIIITGVSISPKEMTMNLHETCQLSYKVTPSKVQTSVTWESDNKECVEVSQTGLLTPIAIGNARVIVKTDVGEKTDTCNVKVLPDPEKIDVPEKMVLNYRESGKIPVTVIPCEAYVEFSWVSNNPSIVSVDGEGNVFANGSGSANISVKTHNGKEAICTVDVMEPEFDFCLEVWLKDGRKVVKRLADKPEARYSDDRFILVSHDFMTEYDVNDVRKFTLSDIPKEESDGITETHISTSKLSNFSNDSLTITDGTPGAKTLIYDISGRLVGSCVADQMGTTYIPMESFPNGVLIIKSETIAYKILKK